MAPTDFQTIRDRAFNLAAEHSILLREIVLNPRLRRSYGRAAYVAGRIEINPTSLADDASVEETIRHELAHLLSFQRYGRSGLGHGANWQRVARELGAIPAARKSMSLDIFHARAAVRDRVEEAKRGDYSVHTRYSGDEFIFAANLSKKEARKVARKAHRDFGDEVVIKNGSGEVVNRYDYDWDVRKFR